MKKKLMIQNIALDEEEYHLPKSISEYNDPIGTERHLIDAPETERGQQTLREMVQEKAEEGEIEMQRISNEQDKKSEGP